MGVLLGIGAILFFFGLILGFILGSIGRNAIASFGLLALLAMSSGFFEGAGSGWFLVALVSAPTGAGYAVGLLAGFLLRNLESLSDQPR